MSRRIALLIGNTDYDDRGLAKLNSPEMDLRELAGLLQDPQVGAFDEVTPLFNRPFADVYPAIAEFFADKQREDTLLLYFSGHGVLDDQGRLYLALTNTRLNRLSGSALPSHFLKDEMDRSRSKRQILLLDCCHSGAFGKGAKGAVGAQAITQDTFAGQGHERVVLTATDKTEMAWEGDQIIDKEMEMSLFTHFVVEGLKTGAADADGDGAVTPNELYNYVYDQVVAATHRQKPHCFVYDRGGELHLARNPRPRPAQLPPQLQEALASPYVATREEALRELVRLLGGADRARSLAAQAALQQVAANDDSRRLAGAAAQALAAFSGPPAAPAATPTPRPTPIPQPPVENDPTATNPRLPVDRERFAAEAASRDAYLKQRAEAARAAKEAAERQGQAEPPPAAKEQVEPPRLPVDRERFAAEAASRDAYLKQRADAAQAAKVEAERQQRQTEAAQAAKVDAERQRQADAARVERERLASQPAPAPVLVPATTVRPPSILGRVALTSLGWAIAMVVTVSSIVGVSIRSNNVTAFVAAVFGGLVGGLFTGLALRAGRTLAGMLAVAFVTAAWGVCQLLFMVVIVNTNDLPALGITLLVVLWAMAGGLTALMGLLALGPARPAPAKSLRILALSAVGWGLSLVAAGLVVAPVAFVLGDLRDAAAQAVGLIFGAVAGAIGGGVMLRQLRSAAPKSA